jgi:hypothetical protein
MNESSMPFSIESLYKSYIPHLAPLSMADRKTIFIATVGAAALVIGGIALYFISQHQVAIAQISSNTTNRVNNSTVSSTPMPYPADTIQYNLTYGEWTARWWQWVSSIPEDRNPVADQTGENCGEGQSGPVWFLAGTFGGLNERNCEIPAGKSILFPILNAACTKFEYPQLQTESELRSCAISLNEAVIELIVTIDGQPINEQQLNRVQSPLFVLNLPEGNIISGQQGSTEAVSDGFWVFLPPLEPGAHDIHFRGAIVDYTIAGRSFVSESLYHITITE